MRGLLHAAGLAMFDARLIGGEPEQALPRLVRDSNVDVMVIGALSRRVGALGDAVGTLTETLIENLHCDFLLVRDGVPAATLETERGVSRGVETRLPA